MESKVYNFDKVEKITKLDLISKKLGKNLPKANASLKMAIIIPAKNEATGIVETLQAIVNQRALKNTFFNNAFFEVLVLCHNCSDNTYDKCLEFSKAHPGLNLYPIILNSTVADNVGAARRILMNIASERLQDSNGFIISTDADTIPHKKWLFHIEKYQNTAVSLICGFISVNLNNVSGQTRVYLSAKDEYLLLKSKLEDKLLPNPNDPWPRHNYHWGPNMAIKRHAYKAIGGISPLHFLEDVDMYNKVVSKGLVVRHCLKTKVTTSTRIESRCDEGFGAELRVWTQYYGVAYNVEGLEKLLNRYSIYHLIKMLYKSSSLEIFEKISELAHINIALLKIMFEESEQSESLIIKIENFLNNSESWNQAFPNVGVLHACSEIKQYFSSQD